MRKLDHKRVVNMSSMFGDLSSSARYLQGPRLMGSTRGGFTSTGYVSSALERPIAPGTRLEVAGTDPASTVTPPPAGSVTARALGEWLTSLSDAEQDLLFAIVVAELGSGLSTEDRTRMEESLISVLVQHGIYDSAE